MKGFALFVLLISGWAPQDKRPVPSEEDQARAEKTIREIFKEEYAAKTPSSQQQLARRLAGQADESKDDDPVRYVMLREAGSLAMRSGDIELLLKSLGKMSTVYEVTLAAKDAVLSRAESLPQTAEGLCRLTEARFALIQEAEDQEQPDLALRFAHASVTTAKKSKDATLAVRAEALLRSVTDYKAALEKARSSERILNATPDDPTANLAWGQYLCLIKGDWGKGVEFMARGSDSPFKTLSIREVAKFTESAEFVEVADGWWDLAAKEKNPTQRRQLFSHAKDLYERGLLGSPPLVRTKILKRISEIESKTAPPNAVDLLRLIDPKLDAVEGTWQWEDANLVSYPGGRGDKLQIPYLAPLEYDLTLTLQPKGKLHASIMLVGPTSQFMLVFEDSKCYVHLLENETMINDTGADSGKPVSVEITIRKTQVTVSADGKKLIDWVPTWKRVILQDYWGLRNPRALGLGGMQSAVFSKIVLTAISGEGKKLR